MKSKLTKSRKEPLIMFNYLPNTGRTQADCRDIYGWLLTKNEEIAEIFRNKWEGPEKKLKRDYQKILEKKL